MACSDLITTQQLENASIDTITISEVANSRSSVSGAAIQSTTTRNGDTVPTLLGQLSKLGYEPPIPYTSGISFLIDDFAKTVEFNNLVYAPIPSFLPFTTSGTFAGDDDARFNVVNHKLPFNYVFSDVGNMIAKTAIDGSIVTFEQGQLLHVINDHFYHVISSAGYIIVTDVDYDLGGGLVAQRRSNGTLKTGRDNHPHSGSSSYLTLTDQQHLKDRSYTGAANPAISITGQDNQVTNVRFGRDANGSANQVVFMREGSKAPIIDKNYFDDNGYQIIQQSGESTSGIRAIANTSFNCDNDFVLQNNDTQNGIGHSWIVGFNYADQTDSDVAYGATESRGVSFTSCYGGINIANAMIGMKGDSATHLENIQETVHAFNYYRDCYRDVYFSGLVNRNLIQINTINGVDGVAIGDTISGVSSGATGQVLFWFQESRIAQVVSISGSFQNTENYTITGKDTNGALRYVDPVQVHANVIGNIFHKTNTNAGTSTDLGINNYSLRSHFLANSYNAQTARESGSVKAVSCAFAFDTDHANSSYRGWDTAFDGGTNSRAVNIRNSYFWNNTNNIDADLWSESLIENNKMWDGRIRISDMQNTQLIGNKFLSGEIDIQSTTSDNVWKNNKVGNVTLTNLSPNDFKVWESEQYKKNNFYHKITSSTSINSATLTTELIATLSASGNTNRSSVIEWKMASRSPTSGGIRRTDIGRAFVEWDDLGVPSITLDPSNFKAGSPSIDLLIAINGGDVELSFDYQFINANCSSSVDLDIVTQGITVSPVKYIDYI